MNEMGYSSTWIVFLILSIFPHAAMFVYLIWARKETVKRRNEWFEILGER